MSQLDYEKLKQMQDNFRELGCNSLEDCEFVMIPIIEKNVIKRIINSILIRIEMLEIYIYNNIRVPILDFYFKFIKKIR